MASFKNIFTTAYMVPCDDNSSCFKISTQSLYLRAYLATVVRKLG